MVLLMPVLMVALPLSGIAGVVYALQYNRNGRRQRLFGDEKKQLQPACARSPGDPTWVRQTCQVDVVARGYRRYR